MITLESINAFVLSLLILLSGEDRSEKEIDLLLQLTNPTQDVVLTLLSLLLKYQHLGALQNVFPHLQARDGEVVGDRLHPDPLPVGDAAVDPLVRVEAGRLERQALVEEKNSGAAGQFGQERLAAGELFDPEAAGK